jgi:hypothetical protein
MLTILSTPKPFVGHIGLIQRNAIGSWVRLSPRPQIILFGDSAGAHEVAAEFGLEHVPSVDANELGTPYLRALIENGERRARHDLICYLNGDIILTEGLERAVGSAAAGQGPFLMVSARINLDLDVPILFDNDWRAWLSQSCKARGTTGDHTSIDFFLFPKGLYRDVPPLTIGRAWFDQWMIKAARSRGPVVDISALSPIVHQNHGYGHVAGGRTTVYQGVEAERNMAIYGHQPHAFTLLDCTHELGRDGKVRRVLFRKERFQARQLLWDLIVRRTGPLRHALRNRLRPDSKPRRPTAERP